MVGILSNFASNVLEQRLCDILRSLKFRKFSIVNPLTILRFEIFFSK